jgi:serine protease Do
LENHSGVRVHAVAPDSPAATAGLESGDLIVQIDGETLSSIDHLHRLMDERHIRRPTSITLLRRGRKITTTVTALERPQS